MVLEVSAPADEVRTAETVAALLELGGTAVEESGDKLRTYLRPAADGGQLIGRARSRLTEVGVESESIRWSWQQDEDWAETWKQGLRPRRVGQRLVVGPSWMPVAGTAGDVVIVIDPGMAFGTAEHATTRGALRLLERAVRPGHVVLDMGTGTGLLAIAAACLGADHVVAVDRQREAVEAARANVFANGVAERVEVREATIDAASLSALGPGGFDIVVANVISSVLVPLLPAFRASLSAGGALILAGILAAEAETVTIAAAAAGLGLDSAEQEDEWWAAAFRQS